MTIEDNISYWAIPRGTETYREMNIPDTYWDLQDKTIALARQQATTDLSLGINTLGLLQALLNTLLVASGTPYATTPEQQVNELISRISEKIDPNFLDQVMKTINSTGPYGPKMTEILKNQLTKQKRFSF